jgi:hypothetical protein
MRAAGLNSASPGVVSRSSSIKREDVMNQASRKMMSGLSVASAFMLLVGMPNTTRANRDDPIFELLGEHHIVNIHSIAWIEDNKNKDMVYITFNAANANGPISLPLTDAKDMEKARSYLQNRRARFLKQVGDCYINVNNISYFQSSSNKNDEYIDVHFGAAVAGGLMAKRFSGRMPRRPLSKSWESD